MEDALPARAIARNHILVASLIPTVKRKHITLVSHNDLTARSHLTMECTRTRLRVIIKNKQLNFHRTTGLRVADIDPSKLDAISGIGVGHV